MIGRGGLGLTGLGRVWSGLGLGIPSGGPIVNRVRVRDSARVRVRVGVEVRVRVYHPKVWS
eukprot:1383788-Amorphochlora_amoeboformis.AAC.1